MTQRNNHKNYVNYDLHITQQEHFYDVRASCPSLAGQATGQCMFPFSNQEIEAHTWLDSSPKEIGKRLYDTVFQDKIGIHLHRCLAVAEKNEDGLRIRLHLSDVPQLASLPWEYLYDTNYDEFFALSTRTPVVRYLEVPTGESTMRVEGIVNVLAILADPTDVEPHLAVDQEWEQLQAAFQGSKNQGKIKLHRLPEATTLSLQRYLRENRVDILHFIGHGQFDERDEAGLLLFENDKGRARLVSADTLARLLKDQMPRLVYLNSCDTARTGLLNPLSGTAQELVQHGVPAVVAMQSMIQDRSAIQIATEFYLALMAGYSVDASLVEGRKAVLSTNELAEWGTPVLFMRASDGQIFGPNIPDDEPLSIDVTEQRYSSKFVNRDKQWEGFLKMLKRDTRKQIITIEAPHDMGKTWLIQEMVHKANCSAIPLSLWDFTRRTPWDYLSLVRQAQVQIGVEYFDHMTQVINEATSASRFHQLSQTNSSTRDARACQNSVRDNFGNIQSDSDIVRRNLEMQITDAFLHCLRKIPSETPLLFLLDAVEMAPESTMHWVINNLLEQIRLGKLPNVLIVVAGQAIPTLDESWHSWVGRTGLNPFDKKHISELFDKYMEDQELIPDMEEYLDKYDPHVLELVTKGHPGHLGLIFSNIFVDKLRDKPEENWM